MANENIKKINKIIKDLEAFKRYKRKEVRESIDKMIRELINITNENRRY